MSRVYDFLLGGSHNLRADRILARRLMAAMPGLPEVARANRAFLGRAVRLLLENGIRQFLDLGCGLPTAGSVHEVAGRVDRTVRVVYVDMDPVVVQFARDQLDGHPGLTALCADIRRPCVVLGHAETKRMLDLSQPVGVLAVAVLHFVADADDPAGLVAAYLEAMPPGSRLALSHATADGVATPRGLALAAELTADTPTRLVPRTGGEVAALLDGFQLDPPGLVRLPRWRPDPPADDAAGAGSADARVGQFPGYAAVAVR